MARTTDRTTLTAELTGGFANQLFQWAAGFKLAAEYEAELVIDSRIVERPDGRGLQIATIVPATTTIRPSAIESRFWETAHHQLPRPIVGAFKRVRRASLQFGVRRAADYQQARLLLQRSRPVRLSGLFQEVAELVPSRAQMRNAISLPSAPLYVSRPYAAVHIRRGDYISNPTYAARYGACSPEYFRRAIQEVSPELPILVLSDDRAWAGGFIASLERDAVVLSPEGDHFADFRILAGAAELVLSNSTFSWWAAFLSHAERIFAPEPWFTDSSRDRALVLDGWLTRSRDA